jgi:Chitobiase/beta-hexosaminidase C-terminal domain
MRKTALVLAGLVGAVATAQGQMITLPMQTYNSQLQTMQPLYQAQAPFGVYSPRLQFAEMSAEAKSMGSAMTAESRAVPRRKIEDESERPAPAPTFSPQAGRYTGTTMVTIADVAPDVTIYYTLDGTKPQADSHVYTGPIKVSKSAHLVAIAVPAHKLRSAQVDASYEIVRPNSDWQP